MNDIKYETALLKFFDKFLPPKTKIVTFGDVFMSQRIKRGNYRNLKKHL